MLRDPRPARCRLLAAAACGGGDDGDEASADDPSTGDRGDSATGDTTRSGDDTEPVRGGTLVYAVEADTSPARGRPRRCSAPPRATRRSGAPSTSRSSLIGDDGEVYPYLLESITPNDDFTVWTLVVRDGIKFHDGTPLDGRRGRVQPERHRRTPPSSAWPSQPMETVDRPTAP